MGLSWARLTLPLRKERQCYDLRFQRALANLRRTSNTEASNRSSEDRIREARRTLPLRTGIDTEVSRYILVLAIRSS